MMTDAEKVAVKIGNLISDVSLDLDKVGENIAKQRTMTYNRFMLIAESAVDTKNGVSDHIGLHQDGVR